MKHITFSRIGKVALVAGASLRVGRAALVAAALCVATAPSPSFAETYTWAGASGADWAVATSWSPSGTPTSADTIRFENASALSVGGSGTLTVAKIVTTGAGAVTFDCPVQFAGTYFVEKNGAVKFPDGATATYPDASIRTSSSSDLARTLDGDFTFTEDWSVPSNGGTNANYDKPWIVPNGSTVRGRNFTGTQSGACRILRVEAGGYACFTTVTNGLGKGDIDINGTLEATKEIVCYTQGGWKNFGRDGNTGTLKAPRIGKYGSNYVMCYITNFIVGSGGFGCLNKDFNWRFAKDATITAYEGFDFLGVLSGNDWGLSLNGKTVTVNVPEDITVTCGIGISNTSGVIRKTGAGTLVMTDTYNGQSGFKKDYTGGTVVEEGTLRVAANDSIGTGAVTVGANGHLEVASGVTLANIVKTETVGAGSVYMARGSSIAVSADAPCRLASFETATDGFATITTSSSAAEGAILLSGASASARLSYPSGFTFAGGVLYVPLTITPAATDYVWAGGASGDWSAASNWRVNGTTPAAAPTSADVIYFDNTAAVTVGGSAALAIAKIITTTPATVAFGCPVAFGGTYLVDNKFVSPVYSQGVTATYPDDSLAGGSELNRTLPDGLTLTADWTVPAAAKGTGNCFIVPAGARISGKKITGESYTENQPCFRIDKGAIATFTEIPNANHFGFHLNDGRLVVTGSILIDAAATGSDWYHFDYKNGTYGTVEAEGIGYSSSGINYIQLNATNYVIGAGGLAMTRSGGTYKFQRTARLTATADMTIAKNGSSKVELQGGTVLTIDTAGHRIQFDNEIKSTTGKIVKEGEGELVMQTGDKNHTGGTDVKGGTLTVGIANGLGTGTVTVRSGATLAWSVAASVNALVLEDGAILKPAQGVALAASALALPASGAVAVDMSGFTFTDGVAVSVLSGVSAGDEAKFTAILPENVQGEFSVASGVLRFTSGSAADLYWSVGSSDWSASVAAWTNAAGMAMKFVDYANATIADPVTVTIPSDVIANDVTVSSDGDVTLQGAGKIGGTGTFTKGGAGTLTFNATGGLDGQTILVTNGVFKVGNDLKAADALGGSTDATPIIVKDAGTFDLNYRGDGSAGVTRNKVIHISGNGYNNQGALVSSAYCWRGISKLVLDDDALIGGNETIRVSNDHASNYVRKDTEISGAGKTLSTKITAPGGFALQGATVTLGELDVVSGGKLKIFSGNTFNIANGIHFVNGGTLEFQNTPDNIPAITVHAGTCTIANGYSGATFVGDVTVASGATLRQDAGSRTFNFNGAVNGLTVAAGTANFGGDVTDLAISGGTANLWGTAFTVSGGTGGITCTNGVLAVGAGGNGGMVRADVLPPADTVRVEGGTLQVVNDAVPALTHRWSFTDGSFADSVGNSTATKQGSGSIATSSGAVSLPGGGNGTCYLDMGKGVLPVSGAATIEIWARQDAVQSYARIFTAGTANNDFLSSFWSNGTNVGGDIVQMKSNTSGLADDIVSRNEMGGYALGTEFHISMTIEPRADGKALVSWSKRDASTGEVLKSASAVTKGVWLLAKYATNGKFFIGHGYDNNDAQATYNEVRIWKGALSAAALTLSAQKGADATESDIAEILAANTVSERVLDMAGGTLDLVNGTFRQPVVKAGSGTVQNGTLAVTSNLVVNLADCIAGNCLVAGGTIDLTGAALVLEDPETLDSYNGSITFLRTTTGGSIVGEPVCPQLSKGWRISIRDGKARLVKGSFTIFIR